LRSQPATAEVQKKILPIIEATCLQCHKGDKIEGEFDLSRFPGGNAAVEAGDERERVGKRIRLDKMPPQVSPGLIDAQNGQFLRWVESKPNQDLSRQHGSVGGRGLRAGLNRGLMTSTP